MNAVRFHRFGGPDALTAEEAPVPIPVGDEVLIRIHAAGINPVDGKIRSGDFPPYRPTLPAIPGRDVAGVIVRTGRGAARWSEGDAVYGMLDYVRGAYAEFAVASPREIARKPARLDYVHAAGVPVAALTAWQAIHDHARVQVGQRVLIHGAAGGVGHFAVQLAAAAGAEVLTTARADDTDFLRRLGAVRVVDHRTQAFEQEIGEADVVLDLVGGETRDRSWAVLRQGGVLVSTLGEPSVPGDRSGTRGIGMVAEMRADQLTEIARRIDEERLTVHLARTYPLREAAEAQAYLENEHVRGKVVLSVTAP